MSISAIRYPLSAIRYPSLLLLLILSLNISAQDPIINSPNSPSGEVCLDFGFFPAESEGLIQLVLDDDLNKPAEVEFTIRLEEDMCQSLTAVDDIKLSIVDAFDQSPYNDDPDGLYDNHLDQINILTANIKIDPQDPSINMNLLDDITAAPNPQTQGQDVSYCEQKFTIDFKTGIPTGSLYSGQNFYLELDVKGTIYKSATFVTWKQYTYTEAKTKKNGTYITYPSSNTNNSVRISKDVNTAYFQLGSEVVIWYKDNIHKIQSGPDSGQIKKYKITDNQDFPDWVLLTFDSALEQNATQYSGIIKYDDWEETQPVTDYSNESGINSAYGVVTDGSDGGVFIDFISNEQNNYYLPNLSSNVPNPTQNEYNQLFLNNYSKVIDTWLGSDIKIVNGYFEDESLYGITDSNNNATYLNSYAIEENEDVGNGNEINAASEVLAHELAHHFFAPNAPPSSIPSHIDNGIAYQHNDPLKVSVMSKIGERDLKDNEVEFNYNSSDQDNSMIHFLRKKKKQ